MSSVLLALVSSSFYLLPTYDFSENLETPSYFVLAPIILPNLIHLKKDRTDAFIYQQLFMDIRDRYHDYIPVYIDGLRDGSSMVFASPETVISMRLPDSAFISTG